MRVKDLTAFTMRKDNETSPLRKSVFVCGTVDVLPEGESATLNSGGGQKRVISRPRTQQAMIVLRVETEI
jgi:hypothetical protein